MREFDLLRIAEEIFREMRGEGRVYVPAGAHDAAYVKVDRKLLVLTCDTVNERNDFPPFMEPEEMGHMALAVTLSDIAACGAKPVFFLSSVSLKEADETLFSKILMGMKKLAEKYGVKVVGGDIDFSDTITIAGFALGVAGKIITRKGAKPGQNLYVTDLPGKAQLCLDMLEEGAFREDLPYADSLYTPEPRINEGMKIARYATAITDISDSLAISAHLLARDSGVRVVLDDVQLDHLSGYTDRALELFLYGGGDFELLYTADESDDGIRIGRIEKGRGVFAELNEKLVNVDFKGYSHF